MAEQLTLADVDISVDQQIELYLRSGWLQPEIAAKGYDPVRIAQIASNLPAELDIDRVPY